MNASERILTELTHIKDSQGVDLIDALLIYCGSDDRVEAIIGILDKHVIELLKAEAIKTNRVIIKTPTLISKKR